MVRMLASKEYMNHTEQLPLGTRNQLALVEDDKTNCEQQMVSQFDFDTNTKQQHALEQLRRQKLASRSSTVAIDHDLLNLRAKAQRMRTSSTYGALQRKYVGAVRTTMQDGE